MFSARDFSPPTMEAPSGDLARDYVQLRTHVDDLRRWMADTLRQFNLPGTVKLSQGTIDDTTIGASTPNTGAFTTISATGQITSTLATGNAPLVVASTTKVANLNVDKLDDADWAAPAAIGTGTPASATFTALSSTNGITNSGAVLTSSGVIRITGNTGLPAAGGSGTFLDYASSVTRAYIGDGTGYSFNFAKRAASVTTDIVTISDAGSVAVGGVAASASTALVTPAGTTGVSSLRVPHGAAPTSPVNGDIWTTTAGIFVRINGATVGPLT